LAAGVGDCEDYAIAKYIALRESGVPEEDLRLLFVHDARVREDHAVVTVHLEGRWLVLDNRWLALAEDTELRRFAPLFSIGSEGLGHWPQPPNEEHRRNGGRMPVRQFFLC
jgi:predicted transglutaminase-like cysteine proteinase